MDKQKVSMYLMTNSEKLPIENIPYITERLTNADEKQEMMIFGTSLNNPMMMLIVSIFVGSLGIDRFIIGDIGLGIGKLITCGGFGLWWLIDLFLIMDATKKKNFEKLNMVL